MSQGSIRELTAGELAEVSGADVTWGEIGIGIGLVGLGITIAATGGLAAVPIAVFGAATGGELFLAGTALGLAGGGGFLIGAGLCW
jgi:hypothetical protein